jgi:hypothetical protein
MPTRCTEAATCSGIRNSWLGRTHAGKPDRPDRTSGPEQTPPSKRRDRQNCQSRNAHQSLLRAMRGATHRSRSHCVLRSGPGRIRSQADRSLCSQSIHVRAWGSPRVAELRRAAARSVPFLSPAVMRGTCTSTTSGRCMSNTSPQGDADQLTELGACPGNGLGIKRSEF